MTAFKTITTSFLLAFAGFATASTINNLTPPTDYDNVGGILEWGQTFTSEGGAVSGVKVYIGDPTRPGVPSVNELTGLLNWFYTKHRAYWLRLSLLETKFSVWVILRRAS